MWPELRNQGDINCFDQEIAEDMKLLVVLCNCGEWKM